jgi:hypothetical protein
MLGVAIVSLGVASSAQAQDTTRSDTTRARPVRSQQRVPITKRESRGEVNLNRQRADSIARADSLARARMEQMRRDSIAAVEKAREDSIAAAEKARTDLSVPVPTPLPVPIQSRVPSKCGRIVCATAICLTAADGIWA